MGWLVTYLVSATVIVAGVAVWVAARLAAAGVLRRNEVAGMRTKATLASDEAWLAAHRASERWQLAAGVVLVVSGVVAMVLTDPVPWSVALLSGAVVAVVLMLLGGRRASAAARAVGRDSVTGDAAEPT